MLKKNSILVLIQTYNDGEYLIKAIKSLLSQTYKKLDILILDDGSDEKNTFIYQKFIKSQKRIKYIYKKNQGIIRSSILLINMAKKSPYDFFAKMDGDDISHKNRIEKQLNLLKKGYDLVGCNYVRMNFKDKIFEKNLCSRNEVSRFNQLMVESIFAHGSICFKRSLLDKNLLKYKSRFSKLPFPEDFNMYHNLLGKCKIGAVDEILYKYRIHKKSYSEKNKKKYQEQLVKISKKYFKINKKKFYKINENYFSNDFFDLIIFFKIFFRNNLWIDTRMYKIILNNLTFVKLIKIFTYYVSRKWKKYINV